MRRAAKGKKKPRRVAKPGLLIRKPVAVGVRVRLYSVDITTGAS